MVFGGYRETVEIVAFVETVGFVLFGGYRETVISLKPLLSWFSVGTVKPLKSLIPLGPLVWWGVV